MDIDDFSNTSNHCPETDVQQEELRHSFENSNSLKIVSQFESYVVKGNGRKIK